MAPMDTILKKEVKRRRMTLTDLARHLGYSRAHITMVANGGPAGKRLAQKIEQWSEGNVPAICLIFPHQDLLHCPRETIPS